MNDLVRVICEFTAKGVTLILMPDPEQPDTLRAETFLQIDGSKKLHEAVRLERLGIWSDEQFGIFIAHNLRMLGDRIDNYLADAAGNK